MLELSESVIKTVFNDQNVYHFKDFTKKERTDFIESLSLKQIQKIVEKVEEFPRCIIKQKCECKHCGEELDIEVEGLQNFYLMMGHDSIASHLQMNFSMIKTRASETISNMMPWERIIGINLYIQDIENERKEYERLEQRMAEFEGLDPNSERDENQRYHLGFVTRYRRRRKT